MSQIETIVGDKLAKAGLRPTRQRFIIGGRLWGIGENRHVTAEQLHGECKDAGAPVSMATVYNTLHQFVDAGLLKEVVVDSGSSYFDTNISEHHHYYYEDSGRLEDIATDAIQLPRIPSPQNGGTVKSVEIIVRMQNDPMAASA